MKPIMNQRRTAFTRIELLVVIVIFLVFLLAASLFLPQHMVHASANRISCLNNLKEIGTAYRLWAEDNGDLVPSQQTVISNGWKDFLT
ncbi:MAG: type II secretion system protein, partial [Verrucomicrobiota bacterium]